MVKDKVLHKETQRSLAHFLVVILTCSSLIFILKKIKFYFSYRNYF